MKVRVIYWTIALASFVFLLLMVNYVKFLKNSPIVTIEPINDGIIVDGKFTDNKLYFFGDEKIEKITVQGYSRIKLFNGKTKIVKLENYEVEIPWVK